MAKLFLMMRNTADHGKSYWSQHHLDKNTKYISRDEIRFSMLEDGDNYFAKEKHVFKEFCRQINSAIEKYDRVFADATHVDFSSRIKLLNQINKNSLEEINIILLDTNLEECIRRNSNRKGREVVPENVIRDMYQRLTIPDINEPFDNIYIIHTGGDIDRISYKRNILKEEL